MNETSSKLIKFNLDDYKRVKKLKFCNFKAGVYGAPSWSNSAFFQFLCETNGGGVWDTPAHKIQISQFQEL